MTLTAFRISFCRFFRPLYRSVDKAIAQCYAGRKVISKAGVQLLLLRGSPVKVRRCRATVNALVHKPDTLTPCP